MLSAGDTPPAFTLPAIVEGTVETVSLADDLRDRIVIVAFYPGDFNPACDEESDLADLELFAMQPDVAVIAIGPDTVFSHRRFAEAYDLSIPLAADTRGEVADAYGAAFEDEYGQSLPERAVFVVDLEGVVQYAWSTRDRQTLAPTEPIQEVLGEIGGDAAAVSRYRVAHAHYVEGRRAFTSAMGEFEGHDWVVARSDFDRAREEFTTARDQFAAAGRFVDHDRLAERFECAESKANALWQAADWLAESADGFSSGDGEDGVAYREDAQAPLETARDLAEPIDPDDITVADGIVSIDADPAEDEFVMDAVRTGLEDDTTAGGVDLDVGDEADGETSPDGPDTDAARRLREHAGAGMDIDEPGGADDDRIADALADTDRVTESGDRPARTDRDAGTDQPGGGLRDDVVTNEGSSGDVTDEEIEEIADALEAKDEGSSG